MRRSTSRVERRHAPGEPTRRREWEIRRGPSTSGTRWRERQATGGWEGQAAGAAGRRDRHGRQVRRASRTTTSTGRRGERREGGVGARADGGREGEVGSWGWRAGPTTADADADAWQGWEAGRGDASWEGRGEGHAGWGEGAASWLVLGQHRVVVGLALGGVGGGDGVDDRLGFLVADLLVVVYDIAQVVATAVVCFAHAHGVVGEVDIAVVAEELRHLECASLVPLVRWIVLSVANVGQSVVGAQQ